MAIFNSYVTNYQRVPKNSYVYVMICHQYVMTKNHELSQVCLDRAVQFGIFMLDFFKQKPIMLIIIIQCQLTLTNINTVETIFTLLTTTNHFSSHVDHVTSPGLGNAVLPRCFRLGCTSSEEQERPAIQPQPHEANSN